MCKAFSSNELRLLEKYWKISNIGVDIQLNVEYITNTMSIFGDILRKRRRESGLSQRELSRQVGVDFSYISKLENGRLPAPAAETILRLSEVMGTSADELLAAAKKIPIAINEKLTEKPAALRFLRKVACMELSDNEWTQLTESLRDLRLPLEKDDTP